ncbi:hypothetical protein [Niastella populi]|uniref:hypothetical protein n=1 Tax=Niastella populi TaxID=550983 RepID=UPI001056BCB2|nr:hypothetical protein [Niastella populi]
MQFDLLHDGRAQLRTQKSSLTRRKVLYSPQFARTRHNAALMAKAAKIGSAVYNALPEYWRQGWMYRSFTGEARKMLGKRLGGDEIEQVLYQRYVEPVVSKQPAREAIAALPVQPKRAYRKQNADYWRGKTLKSKRRKAHKQQVLYNAGILGRASRIGSALYARIPLRCRCRSCYQQLTAWAMQLLRDDWDEADILAGFCPRLQKASQQRAILPKSQKPGIVLSFMPMDNIILLPP